MLLLGVTWFYRRWNKWGGIPTQCSMPSIWKRPYTINVFLLHVQQVDWNNNRSNVFLLQKPSVGPRLGFWLWNSAWSTTAHTAQITKLQTRQLPKADGTSSAGGTSVLYMELELMARPAVTGPYFTGLTGVIRTVSSSSTKYIHTRKAITHTS